MPETPLMTFEFLTYQPHSSPWFIGPSLNSTLHPGHALDAIVIELIPHPAPIIPAPSTLTLLTVLALTLIPHSRR